MESIRSYVPKNAFLTLEKYFDDSFHLKIVNPRKTKLGDFRPTRNRGDKPTITINNNLNQYSFLVTLVHEIAHHHVWRDHKRNAKPHGKEWKSTFKQLMLPFLHPSILPKDVIQALSKYLLKTKASSCSDTNLYRILLKYDINQLPVLDSLPDTAFFTLDGKKVFRKGKKLRTRYKCTEITTKREYFVHSLAHVKIVDK